MDRLFSPSFPGRRFTRSSLFGPAFENTRSSLVSRSCVLATADHAIKSSQTRCSAGHKYWKRSCSAIGTNGLRLRRLNHLPLNRIHELQIPLDELFTEKHPGKGAEREIRTKRQFCRPNAFSNNQRSQSDN